MTQSRHRKVNSFHDRHGTRHPWKKQGLTLHVRDLKMLAVAEDAITAFGYLLLPLPRSPVSKHTYSRAELIRMTDHFYIRGPLTWCVILGRRLAHDSAVVPGVQQTFVGTMHPGSSADKKTATDLNTEETKNHSCRLHMIVLVSLRTHERSLIHSIRTPAQRPLILHQKALSCTSPPLPLKSTSTSRRHPYSYSNTHSITQASPSRSSTHSSLNHPAHPRIQTPSQNPFTMVLPFVSLIHAIVALVAVVPYTVFPIARELVRIQLGYYAMDSYPTPTPWAQLIRTSQPCTVNITYPSPPLLHLQYSPISIWEAPPRRRPPPTRTTPTTSPTSLNDIAPTAPLPTKSALVPAPEAITFAPAVRAALRSAKQWCPSIQTVLAVMDLACVILALVRCAMLLSEVTKLLLPIVYAYVVVWAQRIVLYVCYHLSLVVVAVARRFVPQILWDVVAYRAALRREGRVRP